MLSIVLLGLAAAPPTTRKVHALHELERTAAADVDAFLPGWNAFVESYLRWENVNPQPTFEDGKTHPLDAKYKWVYGVVNAVARAVQAWQDVLAVQAQDATLAVSSAAVPLDPDDPDVL